MENLFYVKNLVFEMLTRGEVVNTKERGTLRKLIRKYKNSNSINLKNFQYWPKFLVSYEKIGEKESRGVVASTRKKRHCLSPPHAERKMLSKVA